MLDALAGGGAHFFRTLSDQVGSTDDEALTTTLWDLVWSGRVTGDTFAPVRALLAGGRTAHRRTRIRPPAHPVCRSPRSARRPRRRSGRAAGAAVPHRARRSVTGRWSLLPLGRASTPPCAPTPPPSCCSTGTASSPAARPRPRTSPAGSPRSTACSAGPRRPGGCAAATSSKGSAPRSSARPVPSTGCAAAPGGSAGDRRHEAPTAVVLAASDPANPYGAALGWPDRAVDPAAGEAPTEPAGNRGAATSRAARPERSSCSSTASSCSTSSGAARRCSPTPTTPTSCGPPPRPSRMPCAAAAWAASPSRRPTAARCWAPGTPSVAALEEAGFHLTPRGLRMRR